jgi:DNA-directed RNA polymerase subunit RPC12/RpoP
MGMMLVRELVNLQYRYRKSLDRIVVCTKCGLSRLVKEKLIGIKKKDLSGRYAPGDDPGCSCGKKE